VQTQTLRWAILQRSILEGPNLRSGMPGAAVIAEHVSRASLSDGLTFPDAAVGQPLSVRVVVHTPLGSVTLVWAIKVRR
jgi:hypothetical protein